jgi:two-component system sensor histidine kinase PhoQ
MTLSLNLRLFLAASAVLAAFFGVTGLVLDKVFYATARGALQERLQSYAYSLIAAAELDAGGAVLLAHPTIADERFFRLDSRIYARIVRNDGRYLWRSPSSFAVGAAVSRRLRAYPARIRAADASGWRRVAQFQYRRRLERRYAARTRLHRERRPRT